MADPDALLRPALADAKRRAEEFARNARAALDPLPRGDCRAVLDAVTGWSVRREK